MKSPASCLIPLALVVVVLSACTPSPDLAPLWNGRSDGTTQSAASTASAPAH